MNHYHLFFHLRSSNHKGEGLSKTCGFLQLQDTASGMSHLLLPVEPTQCPAEGAPPPRAGTPRPQAAPGRKHPAQVVSHCAIPSVAGVQRGEGRKPRALARAVWEAGGRAARCRLLLFVSLRGPKPSTLAADLLAPAISFGQKSHQGFPGSILDNSTPPFFAWNPTPHIHTVAHCDSL